MSLFQPAPRPASLLEVFLQRYANLLRFAESLTRDLREAEDLVQDACVRFLMAPPDISHVENVDAYLFAALRNLHTTRTRRRQLRPEAHLSIVDFDSAGFALDALSQTSPLHARDALRTACRFACARRFTSKTASLFILHFFHGYVRSEIAAIAKLRRVSVDTGLTRGRVEIRAYLDEPEAALRASGLDSIPDLRVDGGRAGDGDDYLARLRAAIFALRHPRCFDARFLHRMYADEATPVAAEVLAELVACPRCLDAVNRLTQLPSLADRHPRDAHEPPSGPRRVSLRTDHERRVCRLAAEQTARIVRAHRPRALRVLVNGFQIGSHDLTAEVTRATHALAAPEPPRVVEIYSEQRVCLATLQVETVPDAAVSQQITIVLDDDRRLELSVVFDAPWPTLHLVFVQPLDEPSAAEEWDEDAVSTPTRDVFKPSEVEAPSSMPWWPPRFQWMPRPVFAGLAVFVFLVVMMGPSRAWSAVTDAGRTVVKWVSGLVLEAPAPRTSTEPKVIDDVARVSDAGVRAPVAVAAPVKAPARTPRGLSESALLGLHVDVLERLDRADALYGEDVMLTSPRSGYLRLEGMVDSPERRRALVDALGALASIPQFEVRLRAIPETPVASASASTSASPSASVPADAAAANTRVFEVERDQSPVAVVLADALMKQGVTAGAAADMARALAVRVVNASHGALRHTWAFKRIARHVDGERLRTVDPAAHRRWRQLLSDHATAFASDSARIHAELTAIGLLPDAGAAEPDAEQHADSEILDAERFVRLAEQQDRSVRALFASSPTAAGDVDVDRTLHDLAAQLRWSAIAAQRVLTR